MRHNVLGTHVIVMPDIGQGQDTRAGENLPTLDLGFLNFNSYQDITLLHPRPQALAGNCLFFRVQLIMGELYAGKGAPILFDVPYIWALPK